MARALHTVIAASFGETTTEPFTEQDNPRDAVLACAAQAAVAVTRGEEDLARDIYKQHLARWPVDIKLAERHLRRFLTLGYVLSDELRERWDTTDLGPSHRRARAAGRVFLQARQGDLRTELPEEHALCFLPLPWSVKLAVRQAAVGRTKLGTWLADRVGASAHRQFRELARDPGLAAGAAKLLATVPAPPEHPIGIEVIGPNLMLGCNGSENLVQISQTGTVQRMFTTPALRTEDLECDRSTFANAATPISTAVPSTTR